MSLFPGPLTYFKTQPPTTVQTTRDSQDLSATLEIADPQGQNDELSVGRATGDLGGRRGLGVFGGTQEGSHTSSTAKCCASLKDSQSDALMAPGIGPLWNRRAGQQRLGCSFLSFLELLTGLAAASRPT
jgi:hypothetical protein